MSVNSDDHTPFSSCLFSCVSCGVYRATVMECQEKTHSVSLVKAPHINSPKVYTAVKMASSINNATLPGPLVIQAWWAGPAAASLFPPQTPHQRVNHVSPDTGLYWPAKTFLLPFCSPFIASSFFFLYFIPKSMGWRGLRSCTVYFLVDAMCLQFLPSICRDGEERRLSILKQANHFCFDWCTLCRGQQCLSSQLSSSYGTCYSLCSILTMTNNCLLLLILTILCAE